MKKLYLRLSSLIEYRPRARKTSIRSTLSTGYYGVVVGREELKRKLIAALSVRMSWDRLYGYGPSNSNTLKACLQAIRSSNSSIIVSLQQSPLGPKMLAALTQAINENPTIRALNLTKAKIKDWSSLPQLFEALAPSLRVVVWEVHHCGLESWLISTPHLCLCPRFPLSLSLPCLLLAIAGTLNMLL